MLNDFISARIGKALRALGGIGPRPADWQREHALKDLSTSEAASIVREVIRTSHIRNVMVLAFAVVPLIFCMVWFAYFSTQQNRSASADLQMLTTKSPCQPDLPLLQPMPASQTSPEQKPSVVQTASNTPAPKPLLRNKKPNEIDDLFDVRR